MVCDGHGSGGSAEYIGDNDAQHGRINVFYHEALSGTYVPRAVLFGLKPGVIGVVTLSRRSANSPARENSSTIRAGKKLGQKPLHKSLAPILLIPPM
jgi:hypothetical protein